MNYAELERQSKRFVAFLGYKKSTLNEMIIYEDRDGNIACIEENWLPYSNLDQLFLVVDEICEKTGWSFDLCGDERPDSWGAQFEDSRTTVVGGIPVIGDRRDAIFKACVEALDHIEKTG